jgi:hypothetical protein
MTRNAIIGKANRLHLLRKPQNPQAKKQPPRREPRLRVAGFTMPLPSPPPAPEAPPSLGLMLYELEPDECRYPYGEAPPFTFCGHAVDRGSSYCPFHRRLCNHQAGPARAFHIPEPWADRRGAR